MTHSNLSCDTILFDLDGTLIQVSQATFISAYFAEISKVFIRLGLDADQAIKALWVGTTAMVLNDGTMTNAQRFWQTFAKELQLTEEELAAVEAQCDSFYTHEFDAVRSVVPAGSIAKQLMRLLQGKGYELVLATNPLFPACAVTTRLHWIDLEPQDFSLITHYTNSTYCKPSLGYYQEIFTKIGKTPQQCLMIGNNPVEDMTVAQLGSETYLVTDCLENEKNVDISGLRSGTLADLGSYLAALPDLRA